MDLDILYRYFHRKTISIGIDLKMFVAIAYNADNPEDIFPIIDKKTIGDALNTFNLFMSRKTFEMNYRFLKYH